MDARSVVSNEDDDKRSVASTTATTTSLASRIQSLAVDFGPKASEGRVEGFPEADDEGDEEVIEIPEEQLLQELDRQEPAFQVCCRLFKDVAPGQVFKRLSLEQAESFQQKGFVVVDGFLAGEHATRLRMETLLLLRQGRLQEACNIGRGNALQDRTARGDSILWLHAGASAAASPSFNALMTAFKELQEDLSQIMRLRLRAAEHQLSYYPPNGAQYVRHRDAFPDDQVESSERKVTAIAYANPGWRREDGGKLRLWPPETTTDAASTGPAAGTASSPGLPAAVIDSVAIANGHAVELGVESEGNSLAGAEAAAAQPRSPKSVSSSVAAEPTEASSLADNASVDGGSVKGSSRPQNGRQAAEEVGAAAVVDVAPLAGRLVLFLSGAVEHAVLPNFADRVAVTMWCQ